MPLWKFKTKKRRRTMKFIEVISDTRDTVNIPVSDIKEIHDWFGGNSSVLTVHGEYYYSELSRKQLIEKIENL